MAGLKLAIFDVDGTLVDSIAHIQRVMQGAFASQNLPEPAPEAIRALVGVSLPEFLHRLHPGLSQAKHAAVIDPNGGDQNVMDALRWKQRFSETSDAQMALATQFCFEAGPVIEWADALRAEGITIPIHIGVAGPAKLQTLIKFSIACGVGASLKVLQKRAKDVTKLLLPYEPDEFIAELAAHKAAHPDFNIEKVHFFPLGGIKTNATWTRTHGGSSGTPLAASA